jgi:hypothetical protein
MQVPSSSARRESFDFQQWLGEQRASGEVGGAPLSFAAA